MPTADHLFAVNGCGPNTLVASCLGKSTGGGLVSFDGQGIHVIDTISTTGLSIADGRILRLPWCEAEFSGSGELMVYDEAGVERYYRIDALTDPHDVLWNGKHFILVSAGQNCLLWLAPNGEIAQVTKFPGEPDSWHVNSLLLRRNELLVAAFGRFEHHREWKCFAGQPCGIIFNLETGKDLVSGLDRPHHPRMMDEWLLVCNSGQRELLQLDGKTGALVKSVQLEKWTRGLTMSDRYVFVGESARRYRPDGDTGAPLASIAILDRATLSVLDRVPLPFEEVYDLILVPQGLVNGLRRGFMTNPQRVAEQAQRLLFAEAGIKPQQLWASGDLLPREACATKVSVEIESMLGPNCFLRRPCVVQNRGGCIFVSAKPHPVVITYRWMHKETGQYDRTLSMATRLPSSVPPGGSVTCSLRLRTPAVEGLYELQVSLFQKGNGFFKKFDPLNVFRTDIWVHHTGATTQ